jgi:hypothetical protein
MVITKGYKNTNGLYVSLTSDGEDITATHTLNGLIQAKFFNETGVIDNDVVLTTELCAVETFEK